MPFDAGSAIATLGLDNSPFTRGMIQSTALMELFPSQVTNFLASPLLGVIGIAKDTAGALVGIFNESALLADNMGDMAASVGVAVEALSGLGLVAQQAGGSTQSAVDAYRRLGDAIAEAAKGEGAQAEMFQSIGVAVADAAGRLRPIEEVMLDLADVLSRTPDAARRTQIAMELLGRGGTQMLPALIQGRQAIEDQIATFKEYGAVVTDEAVRTGDIWQDSLGEMSIAWTGFKNQLAEPIRDALLPYMEQVIGYLRANAPQIREWIQEAVQSGMDLAETVAAFFHEHGELLTFIGSAAGALGGVTVALRLLQGPIGVVTLLWNQYAVAAGAAAAANASMSAGMALTAARAAGLAAALGAAAAGYAIVGQAALTAARDNITFWSSMEEQSANWFGWFQDAISLTSHAAARMAMLRHNPTSERIENLRREEEDLRRRLAAIPTDDLDARLRVEEQIALNLEGQLAHTEQLRKLWREFEAEWGSVPETAGAAAVAVVEADVVAMASVVDRAHAAARATRQALMDTASAQQVVASGEPTADVLERVRDDYLKLRTEFDQQIQLSIDAGFAESEIERLRESWGRLVREFAEKRLGEAINKGAGIEHIQELRVLLAEFLQQSGAAADTFAVPEARSPGRRVRAERPEVDQIRQARDEYAKLQTEFSQRLQLAIDLGDSDKDLAKLRDSWSRLAREFVEHRLRVAVDAGAGEDTLRELRDLLGEIAGSSAPASEALDAVAVAMKRFAEASEGMTGDFMDRLKLPAGTSYFEDRRKEYLSEMRKAASEPIRMAIDEGATKEQVEEIRDALRDSLRAAARDATGAISAAQHENPVFAARTEGPGSWIADAAAGLVDMFVNVEQLVGRGLVAPIALISPEIGRMQQGFGGVGATLASIAGEVQEITGHLGDWRLPLDGAIVGMSGFRREMEQTLAAARQLAAISYGRGRGSSGHQEQGGGGNVSIGDLVLAPPNAEQIAQLVVDKMDARVDQKLNLMVDRFRAGAAARAVREAYRT